MENQKMEPTAQNTTDNTINVSTAESKFTGGAFANYFIRLCTILVSVITLGLAYPAISCWKLRWVASHTYINGKQLVFDGKGAQLFGKYIVWLLLSVITLGIYYVVAMKVSIIKWQTKHTHIVGVEGKESSFDGHWYQLLGWKIVHGIVFAVTLSLGLYWIHCHSERWFCKHKLIDGYRFAFNGKAIGYFGKCILWGLLTVITLGIYSFWLAVKSIKWTVSHTHFENAVIGNDSTLQVTEAATTQSTQSTAQTANNNGGYGLSLAGLILAFIQPQIGLILSIIGTIMSTKANNKTGKILGIIGLVISAIMVAAIILFIVARVFDLPLFAYLI